MDEGNLEMTSILGVVVSVSELSEARRLISLTDKVQVLANRLFKEIEEISGRRLPDLGVCLHDQFSGQLCAPLPRLPAWYSEKVIHFLADVDWWKKQSENLLKERYIADVTGASKVIKQYYELWDLEFLVYLLCGHEACHHLRLFEEDEKYYNVAPRWIEEGVCFYIPYKLIKKKRKGLSELAFETDRVIFEALRQPLSEREHWLYEFYDFDIKYSKAGEEFRGLIDLWDYSASIMAVYELFSVSRKRPKEFMDAISKSYKYVSENLDKVKANKEFMKALFIELGIQDTIADDFCLKFRICSATN
jgi:hypothetical protein